MNGYKKFINTLDYANDLQKKNNIKDALFFKDFKKGVDKYYGSNVDIYIKDKNDVLKMRNILEKKGFKKEFFSFEYDKLMFFPPEGNNTLAKIHIYPYMGWYTLRFPFLKDGFISNTIKHNGFLILNDKAEVPLILFHAYFEDRVLPEYDMTHLREIIRENSFSLNDFKEILSDEYVDRFVEIFNLFEDSDKEEIKFIDNINLFKFILKTKNRTIDKLYYLLIHTLKILKIIRG